MDSDYGGLKLRLDGILGPGEQHKRGVLLVDRI